MKLSVTKLLAPIEIISAPEGVVRGHATEHALAELGAELMRAVADARRGLIVGPLHFEASRNPDPFSGERLEWSLEIVKVPE